MNGCNAFFVRDVIKWVRDHLQSDGDECTDLEMERCVVHNNQGKCTQIEDGDDEI